MLNSLLSSPYKASTAIYRTTGSLVKELTLDEDEKIEQAIATDSAAPTVNKEAVDKSVAIAGDDGLVYLMRATSPAIVYAISPAGKVVRKVAVAAPSGAGLPQFGLRVVKNKLAVQFRRTCDSNIDHGSCGGSIYAVFDATTGKRLWRPTKQRRT